MNAGIPWHRSPNWSPPVQYSAPRLKKQTFEAQLREQRTKISNNNPLNQPHLLHCVGALPDSGAGDPGRISRKSILMSLPALMTSSHCRG